MIKEIQEFAGLIPVKVLQFGVRVLLAIIILFIGSRLIKFVRKIIRKSMESANVETGAIQFVESFVKVALYVVLIFFIATFLGVNTASTVALLGSAGVAIGLAVQGSLSNLAGGVLILLLKPFRVGDYIIDGSGKEGTVTEIQVFYTRLVTPDNHMVILPNGTLANNSVVNLTATPCRRLDVGVSVSYQADLQKVKDVLQKVLEQDDKIIKDKERSVLITNLGESGVDVILRCWVNNEFFWDAKWRLTENCKVALDQAGIEIPYPQMDVHVKENEGRE